VVCSVRAWDDVTLETAICWLARDVSMLERATT
jgi:hypothetical protein